MLALVASSPINGPDDQTQSSLNLDDKLKHLAENIKLGMTLQCAILPSAWEDVPGQQTNEDGCVSVKAQTCVTLCCYGLSSLSVCNHRQDEDLCAPFSEPPTVEYMTSICDNSPNGWTSFGWVKGGLQYTASCRDGKEKLLIMEGSA